MKTVSALVVAASLLGAAPVAAQDAVSPQERWGQVAACAAQRSNEARHACVDAVMRAAGVLEREAEVAINRENFGRVAPPPPPPPQVAQSAPRSAPPPVVTAPAPLTGISTRVAAVRTGADRRIVVTTTEGAVWRQADTGAIRRPPRVGEVFAVEEGALGSYRCTFNETTTFRCERRD